ncbi:amino acid adenylation domain-containing protein, partial [Nonomuraea sp. NPDC049269]|uniref:amino acid adenylation domain-containing protein n=1 Tax=Nonomuraea sp. NPDC049269 TaxID=3364349 RepID=UPI00371A4F28
TTTTTNAAIADLAQPTGQDPERVEPAADQTSTESLPAAGRLRTLVLGRPALQAQLDTLPVQPPAHRTHPAQAAYLMYTSGSTGTPKGVLIPHRGLTNRITWTQHTYHLTPHDKVLHKTPTTFDISLWELLGPLTAGAQLILAKPGHHGDPEHLLHLINHHNITLIHLIPTLLTHLLNQNDTNQQGNATSPTSLRHVFCGGETLPATTVTAFYQRHPTTTLHNLYGPTETSIDATAYTCPHPHPHPGQTPAINPPIGTPLANTTTHILDPHLNPTPTGIPGELFIGGQGLAHGYHHQPALTAQRFIANPHTSDGSRLYRTGDLTRHDPHGNIHFLGRTDHQVKIRGHRIEPAEIQHALTGHPRIAAALVTTHHTGPEADGGNAGTGQRLIAYLVPADPSDGIPATDDLRSYLAAGLPDYMIPSVFIELAAFPLSPNGKIDRAALPVPDGSRPDLADSYQPPTTPTEQLLAG